MTPDEATELFINLTKMHTDIDVALLDVDAIREHFREIFAR